MKKTFNTFAVIFSLHLLFLFCGCFSTDCIKGTGPISSEKREVNSFENIETNGSSNIHIKKGEQFSVEIKDHSDLLDYFKTEVILSTLKLNFDGISCINNSEMEIFITMPDLKEINSLGSGNIDVTGNFKGKVFKTNILGSGEIAITDNCSFEKLEATISGSGNINAKEGTFNTAKLEILGSGSMLVNAINSMDVEINGSGSITYIGDPSIKSNINGSGTINKRSK